MNHHADDHPPTIDLNADAGESPDALRDGCEAALLDQLSSVSVACGAHAGDERTIHDTIALAIERRLRIGAHPSYPDRAHAGRRSIAIDPDDLAHAIRAQIQLVIRIADRLGARIAHAKPHGALYHDASRHPPIADAILRAVRESDPTLTIVAQAHSPAAERWQRAGATVIHEAFADRRYQPDGTLLPRTHPMALITDPDHAAAQALAIARSAHAVAHDGTTIPIHARTLCVHADTPGAHHIAQRIRNALHGAGITIAPPPP